MFDKSEKTACLAASGGSTQPDYLRQMISAAEIETESCGHSVDRIDDMILVFSPATIPYPAFRINQVFLGS